MGKNLIIGYAYLVGDPIHRWHIQAMKNAKTLCDVLIVGVLTDKAVMEEKPKPILSFEERIFIVSELKSVDIVVAQDTYTPKYNCRVIKPDILFESESHFKPHKNQFGQTIVLPYFPTQSSTKIKEKIRGQS